MAKRGKKRRLSKNVEEEKTVQLIQDVIEFEDFRQSMLPKLRKLLKRGATPKEILDEAKALAAARLATVAVTTTDEDRALRAIDKVLDRTEGKATEKKEVSHRFDKLSDKELDAVVLSEMDTLQTELDEDEEKRTH
jgi:hypothetical protein